MADFVITTTVTGLPNSYLAGGDDNLDKIANYQDAMEAAMRAGLADDDVLGPSAHLADAVEIRRQVTMTSLDDEGEAHVVVELNLHGLPNRMTAAGDANLQTFIGSLSGAIGELLSADALLAEDGAVLLATVSYGHTVT